MSLCKNWEAIIHRGKEYMEEFLFIDFYFIFLFIIDE